MDVLGACLLESVPWLLGAAFCFGVAAAPGWRATRRDALALAGLTVASLAYRTLVFPAVYFHQNGQGPLWIERAIVGNADDYGPGVIELFHGAIALSRKDPERAVFAVQGLLAAATPACAWLLARRAGADRLLAWVLAAAVAFDPMLARLSRSESYFGTGASLLFLAAATLCLPATRAPVKSARFVLACCAAAMIIAQAARLQPILWVASALTPLVLLVGEGSLRRRLRAALAASAMIAVVVVLSSAEAMWHAFHSDLSARMSEYLHRGFEQRCIAHLRWLMPLGALAVATSQRRLRALLHLPLIPVVVAVADWADFFAATQQRAWIQAGYTRLYAPAAVVLAAALLRGASGTRARAMAVAGAVALALLAGAALRWRDYTTIPTDALEQNLARGWTRSLPYNTRVAFHCRAASLTLLLPVYPSIDPLGHQTHCIDVARPPEERLLAHGVSYYYRSSACSTQEAQPHCDGLERLYALEPVAAWTLPAISSYFVGYERATVRVALFRVTSARRPHAARR